MSDDPVIWNGFDQVPARDHGESGLVCDFERSFGRRCKLWVICVRRCKLWVIVSREGYSRLGAHVKDGAQMACRHNLIFTHLWCVFQQLPAPLPPALAIPAAPAGPAFGLGPGCYMPS